MENNKQINSDEESDYSENKNQYEQDRRLRNRNKIRRLDRLRYGNIVITEQHESKSYDDVITCSKTIKWKEAMDDEIDFLKKTQTWILVNPPLDHQVINNRSITNKNNDGSVQRFKTKFVACCFQTNCWS